MAWCVMRISRAAQQNMEPIKALFCWLAIIEWCMGMMWWSAMHQLRQNNGEVGSHTRHWFPVRSPKTSWRTKIIPERNRIQSAWADSHVLFTATPQEVLGQGKNPSVVNSVVLVQSIGLAARKAISHNNYDLGTMKLLGVTLQRCKSAWYNVIYF